MKKRKMVAKKSPAKKSGKAKAIKAVAPKVAARALKPAGRVWGEGPWAVKRVPQVKSIAALPAESRPALEDVFNHQVKSQYAPLSRLGAPRMVWNVRAILIIVAVLVWIVALFKPFK